AFADRPPAVVQDVTFLDARGDVGIAAVIDELRAASVHRTVERPVFVQRENVIQTARRPLSRLAAADALAGVLDHLAVGGNILIGVNAPAMDFRAPNADAKGHLLRIDNGLAAAKMWARLPLPHQALILDLMTSMSSRTDAALLSRAAFSSGWSFSS